jgi:hypothetical protein
MIMKMVFRKGLEDPKPMLRVGMLFLGIGLAWPLLVPVTGNLSPDAIDGIKGFLLGIGIALSLWAVRLVGRQRRAGRM